MPAGVQGYDLYRDGDALHLLAALPGPGGKGTALFHARSCDGGRTWSRLARADAGAEGPLPVRPVNDPQVAASGRTVVAAWTTEGMGYMNRGPLATAVSRDGGRSWKPGPRPAPRADRKGQAFADLAADARGRFHLVWLDDRDGSFKALVHATSDDGGDSWSTPDVADERACQCCWNRLVLDSMGAPWVLYRDLDPRDMGLVRLHDRTWEPVAGVGLFGWMEDGCPHVGGGLAVTGGGEAPIAQAVVWTGKEGAAGLHLVSVRGTGAPGGLPLRVGGPGARHADLAAGADGRLACVWDEDPVGEQAGATYAMASADGGSTWAEPMRLSPPERKGSFPRVAAVGGGDCVLWIEGVQEAARLRSVRLPAAAARAAQQVLPAAIR